MTRTHYYTPNDELLAAARADIHDGRAPLTVRFSNISSGDMAHAHWDFGDGHTASHPLEAVHTYTVPGTYRVRLTVTDRFGNTDSDDLETITVSEG